MKALLVTSVALLTLPLTSRAADNVTDGKPPIMLHETGAGEGPAWHPDLGLLTSYDGAIMRRSKEGNQSIYMEDSGSNGLLFDREGRLVICQAKYRRIARRDNSGKLTVLADNYRGSKFNQPNDLTIDSANRIYFTDPQYGSRDKMEMKDSAGKPVEGVYRIDPDGSIERIITHEVDRPNGLAISPDGKWLFANAQTPGITFAITGPWQDLLV